MTLKKIKYIYPMPSITFIPFVLTSSAPKPKLRECSNERPIPTEKTKTFSTRGLVLWNSGMLITTYRYQKDESKSSPGNFSIKQRALTALGPSRKVVILPSQGFQGFDWFLIGERGRTPPANYGKKALIFGHVALEQS